MKIKLFEQKQIRSIWHETEQKWYFSVQDVIKVLTDSSDVKQYIKRMISRDATLKSNWGTICTPVEMVAADGKKKRNTGCRHQRTTFKSNIWFNAIGI